VSSSTSFPLIGTGLCFGRRRLPHLRIGVAIPPFEPTTSWRTKEKLYFIANITLEQVNFKLALENNNGNDNKKKKKKKKKKNKRKRKTTFKTIIAVEVTLCLLAETYRYLARM
jgi:hypothetical protein